MERKEILQKLETIFREVFDNQKITISEETKSSDIENWDSLHSLVLFNEIENVFGISLTLDETMKMKSVSVICEMIEKHL